MWVRASKFGWYFTFSLVELRNKVWKVGLESYRLHHLITIQKIKGLSENMDPVELTPFE
jgi:hypothetical protein